MKYTYTAAVCENVRLRFPLLLLLLLWRRLRLCCCCLLLLQLPLVLLAAAAAAAAAAATALLLVLLGVLFFSFQLSCENAVQSCTELTRQVLGTN